MSYRGDDASKAERWRTAYRGRYRYMNHWAAIHNAVLGNSTDAKAPWRDETPITRGEIDGWIREGVERYPELVIPAEVKFSDELVPVDFGGEPRQNTQYYQETSRYLVYSPDGKPIRLSVEAGDAYGGLRQTATLSDMKGAVIKEFKPKPGEKIEMEIAVPGPGIYRYVYSDGGAYHRVKWAADQVVSLPLQAGDLRAMARVDEMYFYVPKGTKEINYYYKRAAWQFGGPHTLTDSNGQIASEVAVDGDYVTVPVAPGTDGQIWKIGGPTFGLGQFRFFNIPNYFSPNPNAMLLPKDVVAKDGLKKLN